MSENCCLCALAVGQSGRVTDIDAQEPMRRRLLDLGLIRDTCVTCVGKSPSGDPAAYLIRGAVIALRNGDAKGVHVAEGQSRTAQPNDQVIALAGNPNVGKSTVFNYLTGLRQHTGYEKYSQFEMQKSVSINRPLFPL